MNSHHTPQVRVHQEPQAVFQLGDGVGELDDVGIFVSEITGNDGQPHAGTNGAENADQGIHTVNTGLLQPVIVHPLAHG